MEAGLEKRLSLDTNVLFDLAGQEDFAHDFRVVFQQRGYSLLIGPTVVSELYFFQLCGSPEEKRLARLAIEGLATWDVQAFPLTGVQLAISRRFATQLIDRGLLPKSEINDARIVAETSVAGLPLVVSSDHHLLAIDEDALREECLEAKLPIVYPVSPRRLVRALR